jgi:hypothetical protein
MRRRIWGRLLDIADGIVTSLVYSPLSGPDVTTVGEATEKRAKLREWAASGDIPVDAASTDTKVSDFDERMDRFRRSTSQPREPRG